MVAYNFFALTDVESLEVGAHIPTAPGELELR